MSKRILLGIFMLFALFQAQAQTGMKVGYADTDSILVSLPEFKTQQRVLESYGKQLQTQLKTTFEKAQASMAKLQQQAQAGQITEAAFQQESYKLQLQLQQAESEAQQRLAEKEKELLTPLSEKVLDGVEAYGKTNGYTYIFSQKMLISAVGGEDITQKIIESLIGG